MYLTFTEFTTYEGSTPVITETQFNQYEFEAEGILNWFTFDRLSEDTTYPEKVKRCMYALVKYIAKKRDMMNLNAIGDNANDVAGQITSQSNDGVSTTYEAVSPYNLMTFCDKESESIINYNLRNVTNSAGRKLLYRGYYPGE